MISSCYFDKGNFADSQQDALVLEVVVLKKRAAALLVVCDGIGGLKEGDYASGYVTMRIRNWFYEDCLKHLQRRRGRRRIERSLTGMLYDCNRYLQQYGKEYGIKLGTTMTMALLQGRQFLKRGFTVHSARYLIFHAGDSRAYLIGKSCKRLTEDDRSGDNALCRCIGSFPWKGLQKRRGRLRRGEKLLMCSDGFWRMLKEEELAESLGCGRRLWKKRKTTDGQLEKRLCKLGETGRARGEKDNQAAVIAGWETSLT